MTINDITLEKGLNKEDIPIIIRLMHRAEYTKTIFSDPNPENWDNAYTSAFKSCAEFYQKLPHEEKTRLINEVSNLTAKVRD